MKELEWVLADKEEKVNMENKKKWCHCGQNILKTDEELVNGVCNECR